MTLYLHPSLESILKILEYILCIYYDLNELVMHGKTILKPAILMNESNLFVK